MPGCKREPKDIFGARKYAILQQQLGDTFTKTLEACKKLCCRERKAKVRNRASEVLRRLARIQPDKRTDRLGQIFEGLHQNTAAATAATSSDTRLWKLAGAVDGRMHSALDDGGVELKNCLEALTFVAIREIVRMLLETEFFDCLQTWAKMWLCTAQFDEYYTPASSSEGRAQPRKKGDKEGNDQRLRVQIDLIVSRNVTALAPLLGAHVFSPSGEKSGGRDVGQPQFDLMRLGRITPFLRLPLDRSAAERGRKFIEIMEQAEYARTISRVVEPDWVPPDGSEYPSLFDWQQDKEIPEDGFSSKLWVFVDRVSPKTSVVADLASPAKDGLCRRTAEVANTHGFVPAAVAETFEPESMLWMIGNHSGWENPGDTTMYVVSDIVHRGDDPSALQFDDLLPEQLGSLCDMPARHPGAVFSVMSFDRMSMAEPEISAVFDAMATHGCYLHPAGIVPKPLCVPTGWREDHRFICLAALVGRFHAVRDTTARFASRATAAAQEDPSLFHATVTVTEKSLAMHKKTTWATADAELLPTELPPKNAAELQSRMVSAGLRYKQKNASSGTDSQYLLNMDAAGEANVGPQHIQAVPEWQVTEDSAAGSLSAATSIAARASKRRRPDSGAPLATQTNRSAVINKRECCTRPIGWSRYVA
jgi:hypothetical protein